MSLNDVEMRLNIDRVARFNQKNIYFKPVIWGDPHRYSNSTLYFTFFSDIDVTPMPDQDDYDKEGLSSSL